MPTLVPMTQPEFEAWLAALVPAYARDKVDSGEWTEDHALELAAEGTRGLLPQGLATPGHHVASRHRQGHASRAFAALEEEVRRRGLAGIALHVFGHNAPAIALYAKLGFHPTDLNLYKPVR